MAIRQEKRSVAVRRETDGLRQEEWDLLRAAAIIEKAESECRRLRAGVDQIVTAGKAAVERRMRDGADASRHICQDGQRGQSGTAGAHPQYADPAPRRRIE